MSKPEVIVLSTDDEDTFRWLSGGWYQAKVRHTAKAQQLWQKVISCIKAGADVKDAINRLKKAGFKVTRDPNFMDLDG